MVRGMYRARTLRRVYRKGTTGKVVLRHIKKKPSRAVCGICKKQLAGVPRERPWKMQRMPKTAKRPERPYGGVLCSACMRREIIRKARQK